MGPGGFGAGLGQNRGGPPGYGGGRVMQARQDHLVGKSITIARGPYKSVTLPPQNKALSSLAM